MDDKDFKIYSGSGDTTINIDYLGSGAQPALDTITLNSVDTISIDNSIYNSIDSLSSPCTITLPSYNYSSSGIGCHTGTWTTSGTTGYTINTSSIFGDPTVEINTDGINVKGDGDIKVGERSLKEFMTKMEQRLAILVPDPAKLEKFEALKKAYEHYKTMESLCFDEPDEETKS